ncbi:MAG TPA: virulence RhuM family protein [bacterium]|nr:virulence RhuM family protein [bacterium]
MNGNISTQAPGGELVLYRTEDGRTQIQCRFSDGTIWLTQAQLSELFQVAVPTVNEHLKGIYADGELPPDATIRKFRIVRQEGLRTVSREIDHYNLDSILAVGYRVRSQRGTQFRQWATACLSEYLTKGFVMDDERLKNPPGPGIPDHFDDLLERIRDIRASERRMYLRVREILALSDDYDPKDEHAQLVFQTVQNKLHFAVTRKTAPELIAERADAKKPNMGLTAWKGGVVRKADIGVAKNYLNEEEITELNRIVVMFLDYAEDQARRRKQIFLKDWQERLDDFLRFNERNVLPDAGTVSRDEAERRANEQYSLFEERRRSVAEAAGEAETIKMIEQAAQQVEKLKSAKRKKTGAQKP